MQLNFQRSLTAAFVATLVAQSGACSSSRSSAQDTADRRVAAPGSASQSPASPTAAPARAQFDLPAPAPMQPVTASAAEQDAFMLQSAKSAWNYVARETTKHGFVGATKSYPYLTIWDIASGMASAYSARELGLISKQEYKQYVDRTLSSLQTIKLYDYQAFNRMYGALDGAMVDHNAKPSTRGMGFSALDHGRLFIWLKLVANDDPEFAPRAKAIVDRVNKERMTSGGYMQGESISAKTDEVQKYQEGRVGYEQYAAEGYALWTAPVSNARNWMLNAKPVTVFGQTLLADTRGGDVMTSEPFVMMGLELGWPDATWRNLSLAVLAAQEERYKRTGIVTMVSEDAIPVPPTYFYYYLLYSDGKPFVVSTVSGVVSDTFPRWVSAKAAFGYHALSPTDYTWRALQTVKYASTGAGWSAGVYEGTKKSTSTYNLNTAALVLESAAYRKRGCAFIVRTCPKG
ncbi:MAG: DUF3131 domain-containing protein [Gemmatimonadaceae bacterium]|nr:DUF3131 domain-containing protein [Gemmatimonadaceae bacterium]